jgi:uncharacterized membrane protein
MAKYILVLLVGVGLLVILPVVGTAQEELEVRPREPLLYGLASFVLPGLGQYLNEEPGKALSHFLIAVAIPVGCYYVHYTLPYYYPLYPVCGLLSLGWAAYSAIDAYETAKRFNEMHGFALNLRWEWAFGKKDQNSRILTLS